MCPLPKRMSNNGLQSTVLVLTLLNFNTGSRPSRYPGISMEIRWPGPAPISTDGASGTSLLNSALHVPDNPQAGTVALSVGIGAGPGQLTGSLCLVSDRS